MVQPRAQPQETVKLGDLMEELIRASDQARAALDAMREQRVADAQRHSELNARLLRLEEAGDARQKVIEAIRQSQHASEISLHTLRAQSGLWGSVGGFLATGLAIATAVVIGLVRQRL